MLLVNPCKHLNKLCLFKITQLLELHHNIWLSKVAYVPLPGLIFKSSFFSHALQWTFSRAVLKYSCSLFAPTIRSDSLAPFLLWHGKVTCFGQWNVNRCLPTSGRCSRSLCFIRHLPFSCAFLETNVKKDTWPPCVMYDYAHHTWLWWAEPLPTHIHHGGWMRRKLLFHQDTKMGGCWLFQINLAYPHWYFWKDQWLLTAQKKTLIPLLVFKVFYNLTWMYLSNVFYNHCSDSTICFFLEPNSSELHLKMSLLSITELSIAA